MFARCSLQRERRTALLHAPPRPLACPGPVTSPRCHPPQDLSRRYADKDAKEGELRLKLRDARGALAARERQLAGAARSLQRASEDKARAQVRGCVCVTCNSNAAMRAACK